MQFSTPLKSATLLRRYKRFLADLSLDDGSVITVHCPNSGSMRSCSTPGSLVRYSTSDNPTRRYPHTLEIVYSQTGWVGINTARTNAIVTEALKNGTITELMPFDSLAREVKTSANNRLDLLLTANEQQCFVEVKNCTYVEDGRAMFPDAVTTRGTKHLLELSRLVRQGQRGVIFYLVQRSDAVAFSPAALIDPVYTETLASAVSQGVEILAYQAAVTPDAIEVVRRLPIHL